MSDETQVTQLLRQLSDGRRHALDELVPVLYDELKSMAALRLQSERPDHTLGATALVHEAYMRLVDVRRVDWRDRARFLAAASRQMRRVLIDHARARSRAGGDDVLLVTLGDATAAKAAEPRELIALDQALEGLESHDPRSCRVVECRCFAGMSVDETSVALETSAGTVTRDWAFARAWLNRALREETVERSDG